MSEVYLDNAATTQVSAPCAQAAYNAMTCIWGNPSSRHRKGIEADELMRSARTAVAAEIGASAEEIYFTSGGTEANNLALLGAARAKARSGNRVIISAVEHSSVLESAAHLAEEGFDVVRIPTDKAGRVSIDDIAAAVNDKTILLSFMLVNNELGAITPVAQISRLLKRMKSQAILHCDAVQGFGKLPIRVRELGCDLMSMSGHKIHAPKGVGALYVRRGVRIRPIVYGGQQQDKLRPGTEPLPNIAAFAEAVRQLDPPAVRLDRLRELNGYLRQRLAEDRLCELAPITINSPDDGIPNILSIATGCIKSETLLNFLSERGIYVSAGSACSKGKASHVLTDAGLDPYIADSTIRISFCGNNTREDIDALADSLYDALSTLVRFR